MPLPLVLPVRSKGRRRRRRTADIVTVPMDASVTAIRLGIASLCYLLAMTLVVTLTPFRFAGTPLHGLTAIWTPTDIVMNIVMFVPLGFLFSLSQSAIRKRVVWAFVLGLLSSALIETAQLFEKERYSSLLDVAMNGIGALLGALAHDLLVARLTRKTSGVFQVRALALEMPLMGLVYLLIPLLWLGALSSGQGTRVWLALPAYAFGGAIIGAVHGGYLFPLRRTPLRMLLIMSVGWSLVSGIMLARRNVVVLAVCTIVCAIAALLQSRYSMRSYETGTSRRFELPTLKLSLPLFATYLALVSLWPLDGADLIWRSGIHFFPAGTMSVDMDVYRALQHIAAFTLVGYVIAEVRGRSDQRYRVMVWQVARWGAGLAMLLEVARGIHPSYGASILLWIAASSASVFGGFMYHLQRDHVRALSNSTVHVDTMIDGRFAA